MRWAGKWIFLYARNGSWEFTIQEKQSVFPWAPVSVVTRVKYGFFSFSQCTGLSYFSFEGYSTITQAQDIDTGYNLMIWWPRNTWSLWAQDQISSRSIRRNEKEMGECPEYAASRELWSSQVKSLPPAPRVGTLSPSYSLSLSWFRVVYPFADFWLLLGFWTGHSSPGLNATHSKAKRRWGNWTWSKICSPDLTCLLWILNEIIY